VSHNGRMKTLPHENFWKFLIIVAIGVAAGPEIVLALEMRILLELLGVALFTTVFAVGAEYLLLETRSRIHDMLLWPAQRALFRSEAGIAEKGTAISYLTMNWDSWLGFVTVMIVLVVVVARGVY
jgi:hypothetical protein